MDISREQIDSVLSKYGFTLHATARSNGVIQRFLYTNINSGISIVVYPDDNSFEISYCIPNSIMTINCPKCSPLYESEPKYNQFHKMYTKFLDILNKMN